MKPRKVAVAEFCWSLLWEEYFLLENYDDFRDVFFYYVLILLNMVCYMIFDQKNEI